MLNKALSGSTLRYADYGLETAVCLRNWLGTYVQNPGDFAVSPCFYHAPIDFVGGAIMRWILLAAHCGGRRLEVIEHIGDQPQQGDVIGHWRVVGVLDHTTLPLKVWASVQRYLSEAKYRN